MPATKEDTVGTHTSLQAYNFLELSEFDLSRCAAVGSDKQEVVPWRDGAYPWWAKQVVLISSALGKRHLVKPQARGSGRSAYDASPTQRPYMRL